MMIRFAACCVLASIVFAACSSQERLREESLLMVSQPMNWHVGFLAPDACTSCQSIRWPFGRRPDVLVLPGQVVTLAPEDIVGAYGTTVDHESFGMAVAVSEDSAAEIARLARAATRQEAELVVEVGGVAIGVLHPGTAKAMGRGITLSFDSREAFDAAAASMGSESTHVHEVSWENYREACRRFYSDDESGLARCLNPDEQREQRRRLREAEKMLEDPDADTDEILELLGVE